MHIASCCDASIIIVVIIIDENMRFAEFVHINTAQNQQK